MASAQVNPPIPVNCKRRKMELALELDLPAPITHTFNDLIFCTAMLLYFPFLRYPEVLVVEWRGNSELRNSKLLNWFAD